MQELRLELDSPQHILDLFVLSGLKRLSLTYHGDDLDEADEAPHLPGAIAVANNGPVQAGAVGSNSGTDWDTLERIVRGHANRPILCDLSLLCCSFHASPLPQLALLTALTSLTFYDCRWKGAQRSLGAFQEDPSRAGYGTGAGDASWSVLTSLVGLQSFGMAQCVVPPINEFDLSALAIAWPGITSLQLQSVIDRISQLPLRPPPARFGAFLSCWSRLEALTLSGSWCNDPRVALDVSLLPPSLTSLIVSSVTLVNSATAKVAIFEKLGQNVELANLATDSVPFGKYRPVSPQSLDAARQKALEDQQAASTNTTVDVQPCQANPSACSSYALDDVRAHSSVCATSSGQATEMHCCRSSVGRGEINGAYGCSGACCASSAAGKLPPPQPTLLALEHLVLGEVRLGPGVMLPLLVRWAPNLRSLEINNLLPNLTDESCTALAALTALTVLRVSQDQEPEGTVETCSISDVPLSPSTHASEGGQRIGTLSGMGLTALTGLKHLRQLEWLPWGCEPLDFVHVDALEQLRRLHLITLRGARDGAIAGRALEALRERLPLCDIDDTEWSGLVDV